jgi:hypothetical protein
MRSLSFFTLLLLISVAPAIAQMGDHGHEHGTDHTMPMRMEQPTKIELTVQSGYSFGAIVNTYDGQIRLDPGFWYGGALDYALRRDILLELSYYYRTSTLTQRGGSPWEPGGSLSLGEQTTHYIQGGTLKTFRRGKVAPFIGGNLGLGIFSSDVPGSSSSTFFTVSGLGGAKIYLSHNIGIRVQGRLILPIFFGSLGFYCGGGGCGAGVGGSGTVEGELSGGLFLAF